MNGIKYVLDTNFILGLLKSAPEVLDIADQQQITTAQCAYSAITRMELLGYPGITHAEERLIAGKLDQLIFFALTGAIEDETIRLRRKYKIKLPDAIIAASSLISGAKLLTLDKALNALVEAELNNSGEAS